ncbi:D-alanyl-D-alanine carboxypeptidase [Streptomyces sp. NPDC001691]|uniref:D-alanyl-D-alanine carboxypeptidase n=1 Tax=Streptomyces sp. NPDC001691 TaxID=3364600 RepID=UPI00368C5B27
MNEKNSARAGGASGEEAVPDERADAVKAPEEAAPGAEAPSSPPADKAGQEAGAAPTGSTRTGRTAAEAWSAQAKTAPKGEGGPNSGHVAADRDQADRADKTLVFRPTASASSSAGTSEEAAADRDENAGNARNAGNPESTDAGAARDPRAHDAASSATPRGERPTASTESDGEQPGVDRAGAKHETAPASGPGRRPDTENRDAAEPDAPSRPAPAAVSGSASVPESDSGAGPVSPSNSDQDKGSTAPSAAGAGSASEVTRTSTPVPGSASDSDAPSATPAPEQNTADDAESGSGSDSGSAKKPPAPSWAARRESDAERTSEFVALKPDLPRPTPSRPAGAVPAPPTPGKKPGQSAVDRERTREFAAPARGDDDRTMALTRPPAPAITPPAAAAASGDSAGSPPPLDLLAQLTNTPPKPETVGRTVTRRIKIWGTLVALIAVVLVAVQALRPLPTPTLKLTAKSTHTAAGGALSLPWPSEGQAVVDIDGLGRMGSYGEMKPLPIGSVAKVMTTYLILRDHPLKAGDKGPSIPVDQKAQDDYTNGVKEKESVVEVKTGQQISELEALQAVMLPSANNVARLLARWDASTEEAFIKKMNDTAKELGMTNTTYTDASGLIESTVSTAEDQVKLAKRAMADPVFRQIAKLPSYTSTTTSGGTTPETARTQRNFNKLVPLYGVVGIKTGSTTKAGGNLLFAAETTVGDTRQLVVGAVFGQHKPNIIETATAASKSLILAADKALKTETVVKKGEVVGQVDDGLGGTVPVVAAKDLTVPVWSGATVSIKLTDGGKTLPHTAKADTEVGTLTVGSGAGEAKVPVTLKDDLAEPSFGAKLTRLG